MLLAMVYDKNYGLTTGKNKAFYKVNNCLTCSLDSALDDMLEVSGMELGQNPIADNNCKIAAKALPQLVLQASLSMLI